MKLDTTVKPTEYANDDPVMIDEEESPIKKKMNSLNSQNQRKDTKSMTDSKAKINISPEKKGPK